MSARSALNVVLDFFGINDSVVSTLKREGKYAEVMSLVNRLTSAIENNEIKLSELKNSLQNESPLGIAYRKMVNQINDITNKNRTLKDISHQAQYKMAKVDNSDLFDVGSNIKELDNYATTVENYFKE